MLNIFQSLTKSANYYLMTLGQKENNHLKHFTSTAKLLTSWLCPQGVLQLAKLQS